MKTLVKKIFLSAKESRQNKGSQLPSLQAKQLLLYRAKEDLIIFGGAAGGGKSYGLLRDFAKPEYIGNSLYRGTIFRRTYAHINNPGGLLDESREIYRALGGFLTEKPPQYRFPSGAKIAFRHLQHSKDKYGYQGAQFTRLGFDELTHFAEDDFFYLASRARSKSGIKPAIRCTTNPDPDSWVFNFISWWINVDGFPDLERCDKPRFFIRQNRQTLWGESPEDLRNRFSSVFKDHPRLRPKSARFIPSLLKDNPALSSIDPEYEGWLLSLPPEERAALFYGNWLVRRGDGAINPDWLQYYKEAPTFDFILQSWDTAATKKESSSYWGCVSIGLKGNMIYLIDVYWGKHKYADGYEKIIQLANEYKPNIILIEEKSTGTTLLQELPKVLRIDFEGCIPTEDKLTRLMSESLPFKNKRILFPSDHPKIQEFEKILIHFDTIKITDPGDAFSQALKWIRTRPIRRYSAGSL